MLAYVCSRCTLECNKATAREYIAKAIKIFTYDYADKIVAGAKAIYRTVHDVHMYTHTHNSVIYTGTHVAHTILDSHNQHNKDTYVYIHSDSKYVIISQLYILYVYTVGIVLAPGGV